MLKSLGAIRGNLEVMAIGKYLLNNMIVFFQLPAYLPRLKLGRDQFRHLVILCRSRERLGAYTGNYSIHHCSLTNNECCIWYIAFFSDSSSSPSTIRRVLQEQRDFLAPSMAVKQEPQQMSDLGDQEDGYEVLASNEYTGVDPRSDR